MSNRTWHDAQIQIQEVSSQNDGCNWNNHGFRTLRITSHEQQERKQEVHNQIQPKQEFESFPTFEIINRFLRNVGVVVQQELRQPSISPENRESKHQFTQIVVM